MKESLVVVQGKALLPPPTLIKMKRQRETIYIGGRRMKRKVNSKQKRKMMDTNKRVLLDRGSYS